MAVYQERQGEPVSEANSLSALPTTQRDILRALKVDHELGTEELGRRIFISAGAVRHHLALLGRAGLVRHRAESDGRGRPRYIYSLTPEGDDLFPATYREFALGLVHGLQNRAPEILDEILEDANANRLELSKVQEEQSAVERAEALRRVLDNEGYMPTVEHGTEGYRLILNHCPILAVARNEPRVCEAEQRYISAVTGAQPERASWRLQNGDFYCAYRVPRPSPAPGEAQVVLPDRA